MTTTNSHEAELKRERRSLNGKLKRRYDTIILLQADIREMRQRLHIVEDQLRDYQPQKANRP